MLSSRYLYLHEALDLGPMWLQQDASVRTEETDNARHAETGMTQHYAEPVPPIHPAAVQTASEQTFRNTAEDSQSETSPNNSPRKTAITPAHAAVMAAVGSRSALNKISEAADGSRSQTHKPSANPPSVPRLHSPVKPARLLAVSICPSPEDMAAGRLFCGADGILLDNMLSAAGIMPSASCRQSWLEYTAFQPSVGEMQAEIPRLREAVRQSGAQSVLLLGQFFPQTELQPLLQQAFDPLPLFAVPHPARLRRQPQLKAQAWAELKKLRALSL